MIPSSPYSFFFVGDDTDVTINSPNATCSSTPLVRNQERTSTQSPRVSWTNFLRELIVTGQGGMALN